METVVSFAFGHPAANGHFPDNPIIPGAVLLDEIIQAITGNMPFQNLPRDIEWVKFLHPVRPGDDVVIHWTVQTDGVVEFDCLSNGQTVLTGRFKNDRVSE